MARVVWPVQAKDDLNQIIAYIRQYNPTAAEATGDRLFSLGESLAKFPNRGRPLPSGVRELVTVRPYVLRYYITDDLVVIIHIRHRSRRPLKP